MKRYRRTTGSQVDNREALLAQFTVWELLENDIENAQQLFDFYLSTGEITEED